MWHYFNFHKEQTIFKKLEKYTLKCTDYRKKPTLNLREVYKDLTFGVSYLEECHGKI